MLFSTYQVQAAQNRAYCVSFERDKSNVQNYSVQKSFLCDVISKMNISFDVVSKSKPCPKWIPRVCVCVDTLGWFRSIQECYGCSTLCRRLSSNVLMNTSIQQSEETPLKFSSKFYPLAKRQPMSENNLQRKHYLSSFQQRNFRTKTERLQ